METRLNHAFFLAVSADTSTNNGAVNLGQSSSGIASAGAQSSGDCNLRFPIPLAIWKRRKNMPDYTCYMLHTGHHVFASKLL